MGEGHLAGSSTSLMLALAMLAEGECRLVSSSFASVAVSGIAVAFTTSTSAVSCSPSASATAVITPCLLVVPTVVVVVSRFVLLLSGKGGSFNRVIALSFIVNLLYYRVKCEVTLRAHVASYDSRVVRVGLLNREDELV
jgi:hypothetical protein